MIIVIVLIILKIKFNNKFIIIIDSNNYKNKSKLK